jgi:hypothetical protein
MGAFAKVSEHFNAAIDEAIPMQAAHQARSQYGPSSWAWQAGTALAKFGAGPTWRKWVWGKSL